MKKYLSVVQLVYRSNRGRFLGVIGLSVLVGLIEGLLTQVNIIVLTSIQNIMAGGGDYGILITSFAVYYFLAPNYYVYLPMEKYLKSKLSQNLKMKMLNDVFAKAYAINMLELEDPGFYDHISKATDNIFGDRFMAIVESIIRIPVLITAIISIVTVLSLQNASLIFLSVLSMIPVFLARYLQGRRFFKLKEAQQSQNRFLNYLWSMFVERGTNRDMRVFGTFQYLSEKYSGSLERITQKNWDYEKRTFFVNTVMNTFRPIGLGLGLLISAYMVYERQISLAVFASISGALSLTQEHTDTLIEVFSNVLNNLPFIRNFFLYAGRPEEPEGEIRLEEPIASVEFRDVHFRYPANDYETLKGVSFFVNEKESAALLGYNGAGKSTIVKLLCGFYKPDKGEVLINGIPTTRLEKKTLWRQMSVVFQNYTQFSLTLRENIGFGKLEQIGDKDRILEFIRNNDGFEFADDLPSGIETVLGRDFGEADLSGGQWQKVAIGRGQFRDYSMIILDEPAASLDPIAEADVYYKFMKIIENKISLIISHRIGSASIADRIILLKDGVVVENGTHKELMALDGEYKALFDLQAQWYVKQDKKNV